MKPIFPEYIDAIAHTATVLLVLYYWSKSRRLTRYALRLKRSETKWKMLAITAGIFITFNLVKKGKHGSKS